MQPEAAVGKALPSDNNNDLHEDDVPLRESSHDVKVLSE